MTGPSPGSGEDYRHLWWHQARRNLAGGVVTWVFLAPGLLAGLWLTRTWPSELVAGWVTGICAAGTLAAGVATVVAGRWLTRRLGKSRSIRPEPPRLVRATVRGELAVVPHPRGLPEHAGARWLVVVPCMVIAAGLMRDTLSETLGPGMIGVWVLVGGAAGGMLAQLWSGLAGPSLALFPDRLETGRLVGRRAVPWPDVLLAVENEREGAVSIHLARGSRLVVRIGTGAREVVEAIESVARSGRADPSFRRSEAI